MHLEEGGPNQVALTKFASGVDLEAGFCKTSCSSACSKFSSVYGELCCEWSESTLGDSICGMSISKGGLCTCGSPANAKVSGNVPSQSKDPLQVIPAPIPVSAPSQKVEAAFEPFPTMEFHPFPTMAWLPFPKFNPFPTMAWIPFKPITIPEGATECLRSCRHPCGWSQNNGDSFCCETSSQGCGMTTINGKCYCSP